MKIYDDYKMLIVGMGAGMAGTDAHDILLAVPGDTEKDIEDDAWQMGLNHAETYGVYPSHEQPDDFDEDDSGGNEYSDNIEGYIDGEYTVKTARHYDGLRCGGGSFASDFIREFQRIGVEPPGWLQTYLDGSLA